jgi:membrane-associated protease RseP (regulator of RpoE activity)
MGVRKPLLVLGLALLPLAQAAQNAQGAPPPAPPPSARAGAAPGAAQPLQDATWVYRFMSGLTVAAIPEQLREHYHAPADRGALVTSVASGSAALDAGVRVGDVLIRVGETAIRDTDDLRRGLWSIAAGKPSTLEVVRKGTHVELDLQRTPPPSSSRPYESSGAATSVRIRLLESELARLELRMKEIREELEKLKEAP